ncbi:hypothetical protein H6P81_021183 [Aristolochia fimbriata]|uniref:Uncharacterized protein n=1 Tax=Aristolochia fimbriata TaxID=158543 RepID=A0AAV7DQP5_ARIFI|nr:hypothetical protein H6P81_021183 [Aristolochia fimbriata]
MNLSRQQALGPQQCASGKSFLYNAVKKLKNPTLAGISLTSLLTKVRKRASGTVLSQPWEGTTKDMFFRMSGFSGEGSRMCCAGQAMHSQDCRDRTSTVPANAWFPLVMWWQG